MFLDLPGDNPMINNISSGILWYLKALMQVQSTSDMCLGAFPADTPCWKSYDALELPYHVLHMAAGQWFNLLVEWCFCSTWIISWESKNAQSCLKQGWHDVDKGPMLAYPKWQLHPSAYCGKRCQTILSMYKYWAKLFKWKKTEIKIIIIIIIIIICVM